MKYGQRAQLRKECSRFLRFAYLIDFLALDSLSGIYIGSVKDMTSRLRNLDQSVDFEEIAKTFSLRITHDDENSQGNEFARNKGQDPLFYVKVEFYPQREIAPECIELVEADEFKLPPSGVSEVRDFSIECHAEVFPETNEEEQAEGDEPQQQMLAVRELKKRVVYNMH